MIGMAFPAFLTLLAFGLASAVVWHVIARYRALGGADGFLAAWFAGWVGGWLGSPVFGHWSINVGGLYIIPAVLGALVGPFMVTAMLRATTMRTAEAPRRDATVSHGSVAPQFDLRKAS